MNKRLLFIFVTLFMALNATSQSIDVGNLLDIKNKKPFRINGGLSANATMYNSNNMAGRQPFTYQLSGNINISILELINIPLSLTYNNYGAQYTYPNPPNRLALFPTYKWAKAYIGDVAMTFSPYTLSEHLFTGGGIELTPGKWQIMAMCGLMTRHVDYNSEHPSIAPSFDRLGYGAKLRYNGNGFFVGATFFTAKDNEKQVTFQTDSLGILPQNNIATSIEFGVNILPKLRLSGEIAGSMLTRDTRSAAINKTMFDRILNRRSSTQFYYAVKASLDYTFLKNTIAIGYERISPEYKTLGGYYFNNDYENITISYARPLFKDKVTIALTGGLQRDDIENTKQSKNTKFVGSANITYNVNEKLSMALSGSTFQGHKVIKSQFDYINQDAPYENLDTLNFTQISQNVDFNLSWNVSSDDKINHLLTFFGSYQEAADKQGEYILPGNLSRFLNASMGYSLDIPHINANINTTFNFTSNYSNLSTTYTFGPSISAAFRFLKKTLLAGLTFSYNRTQDKNPLSQIFNIRLNANYKFLKRHTVQANVLYQHRTTFAQSMNSTTNPKQYSSTASINYFFAF